MRRPSRSGRSAPTEATERVAQAKEKVSACKREVQRAERALHRERTALAAVASAHFPELLENDLFHLNGGGGADSEALGPLLVQRELSHYERESRLSERDARHEVWRASYDGEACVLKEYKLDEPAEWSALLKEVRLLQQLALCPYIAGVQCVFEQRNPTYSAYVQMPFYDGGDMLGWIRAQQPEMWQRKQLLGQLCTALRHVHSHGVAHGDVKLENVLIKLDGIHATAHLADFESARQQRTGTRSLSTTVAGGHAFTELYVAPEILDASLQGGDAKPTPAGDMFSYGVCCLFACCLPTEATAQAEALRRFVSDGRRLAAWSRQAALSADSHLPALLDSLLGPADQRDSASQALLRAFHSTEAAQAAAAAATNEARERTAAAEREAARQEREAERQRAELLREREEQEVALEAAVRESEVEAARREAEIRRQQAALQRQEAEVREQEQAVQRAELEVTASMHAAAEAQAEAARAAAAQRAKADRLRREKAEAEAEMEKKKRELQAEAAVRAAEVAKLEALRRQLRQTTYFDLAFQLPSYWTHQDLANSQPHFGIKPTLHVKSKMQVLLRTTPLNGHAAGCQGRPGLRGATVTKVERVENTLLWKSYCTKRAEMSQLAGLPGGAVPAIAISRHEMLDASLNEIYLFHGTDPATARLISRWGFDERVADMGGLYGAGTYFAENSCKSMQYTKQPNSSGEFTIIYSRVLLGHAFHTSARTQTQWRRAPDRQPGLPHDSVVASGGSQVHREFIVYDRAQTYPEFIIYFKP